MTTTRRQYSPRFKARVAVEEIRGEKTLSQLGAQFQVHPIQIAKWRKAALEQLPELFVDGRTHQGRSEEAAKDALYEEIGRLKVELDWLKKKLDCWNEDRRPQVDGAPAEISVRRQGELLGVNRASWYYEPAGESAENLGLMRVIDEQYTRRLFYGSRRMTAWLQVQGHEVNRKRVSRLMTLLGLEAIYPQPKLSGRGKVTRSIRTCCKGSRWSASITPRFANQLRHLLPNAVGTMLRRPTAIP